MSLNTNADSSGRGRRVWLIMPALAALCIGAAVLRMSIGSAKITWPWDTTFASLRIYSLVVASIVGVALATGGVGLQVLLRNPLAEPFILGLSTGAGVGVMIQQNVEYSTGKSFGPPYGMALAGALVSLLVVYIAARRKGVIDPVGMLLVGVVVSTVNGAVIVLLNQVVSSAGLQINIANWMVGSLKESYDRPTIIAAAGVTAAGWVVMMARGRAMDVASFSDAEAVSMGVHLPRLRTELFVVSGVLAAAAVVLAGPIGFVGLVAPHLARLLVGPSHRRLLPAAAMIGAVLVVAADTLSVGIGSLQRGFSLLPIGVFTAVMGGPVFLTMLRRRIGRSIE